MKALLLKHIKTSQPLAIPPMVRYPTKQESHSLLKVIVTGSDACQ